MEILSTYPPKEEKTIVYCNTGPLLKLFIGRGDDDNDNIRVKTNIPVWSLQSKGDNRSRDRLSSDAHPS